MRARRRPYAGLVALCAAVVGLIYLALWRIAREGHPKDKYCGIYFGPHAHVLGLIIWWPLPD